MTKIYESLAPFSILAPYPASLPAVRRSAYATEGRGKIVTRPPSVRTRLVSIKNYFALKDISSSDLNEIEVTVASFKEAKN